MPAQAQQIIAEMDATGRVFDGLPVAYLSSAMRAICCAELSVPRLTPHDLRRSHGTTITSLGFGRPAMDRIQNHAQGGISSVYDRHEYAEENKEIMEAVASRIMQLVEGGPDNVLAFKRAV